MALMWQRSPVPCEEWRVMTLLGHFALLRSKFYCLTHHLRALLFAVMFYRRRALDGGPFR